LLYVTGTYTIQQTVFENVWSTCRTVLANSSEIYLTVCFHSSHDGRLHVHVHAYVYHIMTA